MPTPAAPFKSRCDPGRRARASVVEGQEHGPARVVPRCMLHQLDRPPGERRSDGVEMPLEVLRLKLIDGGSGSGEAARIPLALFHDVVIHERERVHCFPSEPMPYSSRYCATM